MSSPPSPTASAERTAGGVRRFGDFELDVQAGELRKQGVPVRLQPQPLKVLSLLIDRAGEVVTRDELRKALWGDDTYVDFDRGLNFCINQVRTALDDSAESPRFVQTLPRRGYRFIGELSGQASAVASAPVTTEPERSTPAIPVDKRRRWLTLSAVAALTILVIAGASYIGGRLRAPIAPATPTIIAVLPLDDLTPDQPESWFADGLTEELIAQLGRVSPRRLAVIARTSAMTYRRSSKTIAEIGRELHVSHVVEGSLRREGERVRITMQLVDVGTQAPIWSETYDHARGGSLDIQGEIAAQVARALAIELLPEYPTAARGSTNPEARDAYLRGRYFRTRGRSEDLQSALDQFNLAARTDPAFAQAHAAIADTNHMLVMVGVVPARDAYPRAASAAREAMRLDPDLADGYAALGLVQLWSQWNPAEATKSFERALSLNPSDAATHHDYAWSLLALQRFDEAVAHIMRARDLDPVSARANTDVGWMFLQLRQPSEAVRACTQTLQLQPGFLDAQFCLERAYLQRGDRTAALEAARVGIERSGSAFPVVLSERGDAEESLRALWRWRLDALTRAAASRRISYYSFAMHHALAGQPAAAVDALEKALAERDQSMVLLPTDPVFDELRSDSRFQRVLQQVRGS